MLELILPVSVWAKLKVELQAVVAAQAYHGLQVCAGHTFMVLDRRRHSRQTVFPDVYVDLFPHNAGWLTNISEGGLALGLFFPMVRGQDVRLGFGLPGTRNRIEAKCQIAWTDKFERKAGLRFLDLSEASLQQLREWLSVRTWQTAPENIIPPAKSAGHRGRISVILVLLVISFVVLYPFVQKWLRPQLRSVPPAETTASRNVKVWAVKKTGLYYCPDSRLYGKTELGVLMTEGKALEGGYRPGGGEACR